MALMLSDTYEALIEAGASVPPRKYMSKAADAFD